MLLTFWSALWPPIPIYNAAPLLSENWIRSYILFPKVQSIWSPEVESHPVSCTNFTHALYQPHCPVLLQFFALAPSPFPPSVLLKCGGGALNTIFRFPVHRYFWKPNTSKLEKRSRVYKSQSWHVSRCWFLITIPVSSQVNCVSTLVPGPYFVQVYTNSPFSLPGEPPPNPPAGSNHHYRLHYTPDTYAPHSQPIQQTHCFSCPC